MAAALAHSSYELFSMHALAYSKSAARKAACLHERLRNHSTDGRHQTTLDRSRERGGPPPRRSRGDFERFVKITFA
jgi:hypothetical protein